MKVGHIWAEGGDGRLASRVDEDELVHGLVGERLFALSEVEADEDDASLEEELAGGLGELLGSTGGGGDGLFEVSDGCGAVVSGGFVDGF
ncbi:hypothetical protein G6O69_33930 [Pseudenhygromyxa sp. WMMC2535]|uniref:hypothetical protein n=1 Tax=Pseudenhygromyxa sp. WMMC2535 TaxID=2712867 RepID=UPI00159526CC|nr:hypothetical protein [Pseudenhygromyxa sp. WMMC2535]NVB42870.1 hypothetical protein [Pseudenhygromyxa sp. WMMC2535]